MKYIIMCGGKYRKWARPRHLTLIDGEKLIARTIRQLREHGVDDIAISASHPAFNDFGVPVLKHKNTYDAISYNNFSGYWCEAFYPTDEPVCYIFGDVVFTDNAIRIITETDTDDIEFFASSPPFAPDYPKKWAEPFALKVVDTDHLKQSIELVKRFDQAGAFNRKPIMWELWQVITNGELNQIDYGSYTAINDATCDID